MRLLGDRAGIRLGVGQRLLVAGERLLGLALEPVGGIEVAHDAVAPLVDHLGDARQGDTRQQQIKQAEREGEPDQLRGECGRIERRKAAGAVCIGGYGGTCRGLSSGRGAGRHGVSSLNG